MIRFSIFENYLKPDATMHKVSDWTDFVEAMVGLCEHRPATNYTKKHGTPGVSPAVYETLKRKNENVLGWGGWLALDVDNDGLLMTTVEEAIAILTEMGLNYLIYTSTKSQPKQHRFRVVLPLSRDLEAHEIQAVWTAVVQYFEVLSPDPSCKDISRLYGAPSFWTAAKDGNANPFNAFEFKIDGDSLNVESVLAAYVPPPEPVVVPVISNGVQLQPRSKLPSELEALRQAVVAKKTIPYGATLMHSPVVTSGMVEQYLNLPKGSHHVGLFRFMTQVAGRAKAKGFIISAGDLVAYAHELDLMSPIKTNSERWKGKIHEEAERALRFAATQILS